jgi:biopolymer transport protein TolQ
MVRDSSAAIRVVLAVLVCFSVFSWTVVFSKWQSFRGARRSNARFLRAFRKANGLESIVVASEQFRPSPLVAVFDFGYEEVERQVKARGTLTNRPALERALQLGISEEMATVTPFIGLLGTVMGIIKAFHDLGQQGSTSLRTVAPGISEALITTAVGLVAAIPAAIFYNVFGHSIREMGTRMDDFSLEFLNLVERSFGE